TRVFSAGGGAGAPGGPPPGGPAAAAHPGYRVLEGHFTAIRQAMAVPRQKTQGAAYVNDFIERCKANGLVKAALQRSGQGEVTVAPPAASA
ncbi:restriction endonuclease, partial [Serratia sp. IR-2025]